jgi:hypothetical protein
MRVLCREVVVFSRLYAGRIDLPQRASTLEHEAAGEKSGAACAATAPHSAITTPIMTACLNLGDGTLQ